MSTRFNVFALIALLVQGVSAMAADGVTAVAGNYDPVETVKRLEIAIGAKGMTVFAKIDHAAGAKKAGIDLKPNLLVIFGAPRVGTPLMQTDQSVGIDLPLKALIWQDAAGKTWISYNEPQWIARRHGLGDGAKPTVGKMHEALLAVINEAAGVK
jgi:uncharacterized protein (DUF302 family)